MVNFMQIDMKKKLPIKNMYMTKLRPFVHTFLKEASEMFEMYIYTMGGQHYALEMAKLLDPQGDYFSAKVISCKHATQEHQKGLSYPAWARKCRSDSR